MAKNFTAALSEEQQNGVANVNLAPGESTNIGGVALQEGDVLTFKGELDKVIQVKDFEVSKNNVKHYTVLVDTAGREVSLKQLVRNNNGIDFPSEATKVERLRILAAQLLNGGELVLTVSEIHEVYGMYNGVKTLQKQYIFS